MTTRTSFTMKFLIHCFIIISLVSCQIKNNDQNSLNLKQPTIDSIKSIGNFEGVEVGKEKDQASSSELTVRLINGKNLPADDAGKRQIGIEACKLIRHSGIAADTFNNYKVLFVTRKSSLLASSDTYNGMILSNDEIGQ